MDAADPSFQPGSKIGRYSLVEFLGQGGMGTVYVAHDPELDRRVALKVLRSDRPGAGEAHARFVREARLMAKLTHPNIVTVFDAGEMPGGAYIVMELVEGSSLEGWLAEKARPASDILEKYMIAGYALAAAHTAGVIHRDFKPANVLLDRKGRVAVTDFGIAAVMDAATPDPARGELGNLTLTQAGVMLGTPAFMSPEQFCGERVDPRADQFSFAVALFEALFGEPAFPGQTLQELRAAVIAGKLRQPSPETRERAPAGVHEALVRALSREPADRFPTLLVMLRELERCIGGRGRRRPFPVKLAVGGATLLALAGGAAALTVFFLHRGESSVPAARAATATATPEGAHPLVGLGGKCADASNGVLELRTCNGAEGQSWRLSNGKLQAADGRCVGTHGGSTERRAALELQPCSDVATQSWHMRAGLLESASGRCANVDRNRVRDGTPIILFDCIENAHNEKWRLGVGRSP